MAALQAANYSSMKRLAICFLLVFASFASAGEAWKKFSAADGSFSVSFPVSPMVKRSNQTIKGRQVDYT